MCILKLLYFSAVNYIQYVIMLSLFQGAFTVLGTGYSNRSIHLFDSRYGNPWETKQFLWNFINMFQFWLKMNKNNRCFQCAPLHILALILRVIYWMPIAAKMFQTKAIEKNEICFITIAFFSIICNISRCHIGKHDLLTFIINWCTFPCIFKSQQRYSLLMQSIPNGWHWFSTHTHTHTWKDYHWLLLHQ
jgi:hypothetical protein